MLRSNCRSFTILLSFLSILFTAIRLGISLIMFIGSGEDSLGEPENTTVSVAIYDWTYMHSDVCI